MLSMVELDLVVELDLLLAEAFGPDLRRLGHGDFLRADAEN